MNADPFKVQPLQVAIGCDMEERDERREKCVRQTKSQRYGLRGLRYTALTLTRQFHVPLLY